MEHPLQLLLYIGTFSHKSEDVILNLREREGCRLKDIGYYISATETIYPENFHLKMKLLNG